MDKLGVAEVCEVVLNVGFLCPLAQLFSRLLFVAAYLLQERCVKSELLDCYPACDFVGAHHQTRFHAGRNLRQIPLDFNELAFDLVVVGPTFFRSSDMGGDDLVVAEAGVAGIFGAGIPQGLHGEPIGVQPFHPVFQDGDAFCADGGAEVCD